MEKIFLILILGAASTYAQGTVSCNEFNQAVTSNSFPKPRPDQCNNFNKYVRSLGGINSKQEAAMALAQFLHETGGLVNLRETKCLQNQCSTEYRCSNPEAGCWVNCDVPDKYYYGRGYIQLSWCFNYRDSSKDLLGNEQILLNDPDRVAREEDLAWRTAFWFWKKYVTGASGVQQGQFGATTRAINKMECEAGNQEKERRFSIYGNVRRAFGLPGAGDKSGC